VNQENAFLFEFFVFSLPVLLWCAWELWSLKREKAKDAEKERLSKLEEAARHSERE
jgi:hypothetical protein